MRISFPPHHSSHINAPRPVAAGIGLLGALVATSLGCAVLAHFRCHNPLMRGMSLACIMGVTAILIHSSVDFNLQIPANAVTFVILLALGWVSLHHHERESGPYPARR